MIPIKFHIDKYDWTVYLYLNVDESNLEFILNKLYELKCDYAKAVTAYKVLSKNYVNKGLTYTNYNINTSIVIICVTENKAQLTNSVVHEINHLKSHIANKYNLNEKGEEVSYLIGNIAQKIYEEYTRHMEE